MASKQLCRCKLLQVLYRQAQGLLRRILPWLFVPCKWFCRRMIAMPSKPPQRVAERWILGRSSRAEWALVGSWSSRLRRTRLHLLEEPELSLLVYCSIGWDPGISCWKKCRRNRRRSGWSRVRQSWHNSYPSVLLKKHFLRRKRLPLGLRLG